MKLMKICADTEERKAELARQLAGAWVCDGVLATQLAPGNNGVSQPTLISMLYGLRANEYFDNIVWRQNDPSIDKVSMWKNLHVGFATKIYWVDSDTLPVGKSELLTRWAVRRDRVLAPSKLTILNGNFGSLGEPSRSALIWLLMRRENRTYLPQLIRSLRRSHLRSAINIEEMSRVAKKFGDRFAIAALKLAKRGFKSKRFAPAALKEGDLVRRYYDRWSVHDVVTSKEKKQTIGTVRRVHSGTVELMDGQVYNNVPATCWHEVVGV